MLGFRIAPYGVIVINGNDAGHVDPCGTDDIVDIWLDLNENSRELSFGKNGKALKSVVVKDSTGYKLAITVYSLYGKEYKIELLSFNIT